MCNFNLTDNKGVIDFDTKVNEDVFLFNSLNAILKAKRNYVVKMPEKGSTVVACMSGGLDSIANISILINEYNYTVYPFFINRGQTALSKEREAVHFFDNLFSEKYPNNYKKCLEISVDTPAKEYKDLLRDTKKKMSDVARMRNISYPVRNPIIFLTGAEYAYSLKSKGEDIKTIFAAHVASDFSYHCSQTWTRNMNVLMCQIFDDWEMQFISIPIETEFGNFFDKEVYVHYLDKYGLPIEKTRSCMKKFDKQCGDCPGCYDRRLGIQRAGVADKTEYLYEMSKDYPTYYAHEAEEKEMK